MPYEENYYLGNKNLPKPDTQFDWTPEMLEHLEKSRDDILYFAQTFFFIINLDKGKQLIKLHPCQLRVLKTLDDERFVSLLASRQSGKALALDTPIPTPNGWTTMGALKAGDNVYDSYGKPCKVVMAHEILHNRNCYEVEFDNGEKIVADEEHLWFTQSRDERRKEIDGSVKNTKQLFETLTSGIKKKEPNHRIPSNVNGVCGVHKELPIDPYILGLWLGDGSSNSSVITVGKRDINDLIDILNPQHNQFNKILLNEYNENVYSLRLTVEDGVKTKSLSALLEKANLKDNKHIPTDYLLASREQRLELLKGLIDSDGYIDSRGNANFYNTNIELVKQTKQLIESLGYKVTFKTFIPNLKGVECKECGVLYFKPIEYVCKLAFKKNRIKLKQNVNDSKLRNQWHYVKNIKPVDSVPVRCITVDSVDSLYLCGNQYIPTHNTTLMTIYALWIACFNKDKRVLVVANKEKTAINIFRRIRTAYEMLPNYLKPGVKEYGKTSITLENDSSIGISTTSSDAGRGDSVNVLILDELAFIPNNIVDKFWKSVYPIISSSKQSKIFVASTPNGTKNLFYDLYSGAMEGKNGWAAERIDWWEIPGRDEVWKQNTIREIGSEETFNQEFGNEFIEVGESTLSDKLYEYLKSNIAPPLHIFDDGAYKMWENPNKSSLYVIGVDVAEGVGQNASSIEVFDITDLGNIRQVAEYCNNNINPYTFTQKINQICKHWGSPPVLIERNNHGGGVCDNLKNEYNYTKIVTYTVKAGKLHFDRPGIHSHTNTKYKCMTNMRYWLNETMRVKIKSVDLLNELKSFTRNKNGTWSARSGELDDRVMGMAWALIILDREVCEKYFEVLEFDKNQKPFKIKRLSYSQPGEFVDDFGILTNRKIAQNDNEEDFNEMPSFFTNYGNEPENPEMDDLISQGWERWG